VKDRSTIELMVLAFTVTVCLALLVTGVALAVVAIVNPEADTSFAVDALAHGIGVLMGSLLGLLAGRSSAANSMITRQPKDGE
jgi:hypothetical protein